MPSFSMCAQCPEMIANQYATAQNHTCSMCVRAERLAYSFTVTNGSGCGEDMSLQKLIDRRSQARIRTLLPGELVDGLEACSVEITDMSLGGAMVCAEEELPGDGRLALEIVGTTMVHARRVWRDGGRVGLMFLESPREVLARMTRVAPVFGTLLAA